MSNYVKTKDFAAADALATGSPAKAVKGTDLGLEFDNIAVAIASKLDTSGAANPTGSVGLAAVNGTATTYMRSDAAPALSQAIVPTWTGIHTFSAKPVFSAGITASAASTITTAAGTALALTGPTNNAVQQWTDGTRTGALFIGAGSPNIQLGSVSNHALGLFVNNGTPVFQITAAGVPQTLDASGGTMFDIGFRDTPQNAQGASYSLVLADRGKSVQLNAGTQITIPANASVAFPVGTTIALVNNTAGSVTIAITSDSLVLAGTSTGGAGASRTLASNGVATIYKFSTTGWFISGAGVS